MSDLKPCPFCGETPDLPDGDGTQYEIECQGCGQAIAGVQICDLMTSEERTAAEFINYRYDDEYVKRAMDQAILNWNTRTGSKAMSDLICRKTMRRCQTQGMCSPHGGCSDGVLVHADASYSADASGMQSDQVKRYKFGPNFYTSIVTAGVEFVRADDYASLQAELLKVKEEARHLRSQLNASRNDAELGAAIQHACGELPEGYILTLDLERHGNEISLGLPDTGAVYEGGDFDGDNLSGQIRSAVEKAIALDEGCIDE